MKCRLVIDASKFVAGRPLALEPIYFPSLIGAYAKALRGIALVVVVIPDSWHAAVRGMLDGGGFDAEVEVVNAAPMKPGDVMLDIRDVHHPPILRKALARDGSTLPEPAWVVRTEEDIGRAATTLERRDMYIVARALVIPVARRLAFALRATPVSPNTVTAISCLLGIAAAVLMLGPNWGWRVAAAVCIHLSVTLDFTDGYLARLRGTNSPVGYWFDTLMDEVVKFSLFLGMTLLVARDGPDWALPVGIGVLLLYHVLACNHWLTKSLEPSDLTKSVQSAAPRRQIGVIGGLKRARDRLSYLDVHLYVIAASVLLGLEAWMLLIFGIDYAFRILRVLQIRLTTDRIA